MPPAIFLKLKVQIVLCAAPERNPKLARAEIQIGPSLALKNVTGSDLSLS